MLPESGKIKKNSGPVVLLIIDGWDIGGDDKKTGGAMPYLDDLVAKYPAAMLKAEGGSLSKNYRLLGGEKDNISEIFARNGLKQIKIAEVEKYADLAYFFSGDGGIKREGEERVLVKTDMIDNYAKKPALASAKITEMVIKSLKNRSHDLIVAAFSSLDLVSRSGENDSIARAKKIIDDSVKKISKTVFNRDGWLFIISTSGRPYPAARGKKKIVAIPLIMINRSWEGRAIESGEVPGSDLSLMRFSGTLSNVVPTILQAVGYDGRLRGKPLIN